MTYEELIERLDPNVYRSLRQSIELGKWPDGPKQTFLIPPFKSILIQLMFSNDLRLVLDHLVLLPSCERTTFLKKSALATWIGAAKPVPPAILRCSASRIKTIWIPASLSRSSLERTD